MDVDNPLFWDVIWFLIFGVVPVVVGWLIRGHQHVPERFQAHPSPSFSPWWSRDH
jgi:hypothetical protein